MRNHCWREAAAGLSLAARGAQGAWGQQLAQLRVSKELQFPYMWVSGAGGAAPSPPARLCSCLWCSAVCTVFPNDLGCFQVAAGEHRAGFSCSFPSWCSPSVSPPPSSAAKYPWAGGSAHTELQRKNIGLNLFFNFFFYFSLPSPWDASRTGQGCLCRLQDKGTKGFSSPWHRFISKISSKPKTKKRETEL